MNLDKAKRDRSIEVKQLDVEAVVLADVIGEWGDEAIESRFRKEALELELERTESMLSLSIRGCPSDFGLGDKTTEASIKAAVKLQPKYIELEKKVADAQKEYWQYEHQMKTLEVKRRMLEYLGDLHGKQYFAGPTIPRDLLNEMSMLRRANGQETLELQSQGLKKRPIPKR